MKINGEILAEIAVVGGGPAGIMAAKAAAKEGKKVVLLERNGFLGGCATAGLVVPLMTFHAGKKQIVKGYAQELIDRIKELDGSTGHITDALGFASTVTPVETEVYKYVAQEFLLEEEVDIKFHSEVYDVEVSDDQIQSLLVKTRSGFYRVKADRYIDASGDGEVAFNAGNPMQVGREKDGKCQPMSMMFKVVDIDIDKVIAYADKNPKEFVIHPDYNSLSELPRIAVSGFFSLVEKARKNGDLTVNRDRVLFFEMSKRGEIAVNMSRIINKIATNGFELSEATIEGRRQVFEILNFFRKYLPGFENARLIESASEVGVRETRRIVGEYQLNELDVVTGKKFHDGVAQGSWPIDIHDPEGKKLDYKKMEWGTYYEIPYRSLVPVKTKNLIAAGKIISSTHEAFASSRVSPICMAIGQAAGLAAVVSLEKNVPFKEVEYKELYKYLINTNQSIEIKEFS